MLANSKAAAFKPVNSPGTLHQTGATRLGDLLPLEQLLSHLCLTFGPKSGKFFESHGLNFWP